MASEREWGPVGSAVLPEDGGRDRGQCSDWYYSARDYESTVVHDPTRRYFAPPTQADAAAERWKRQGWVDFEVPQALADTCDHDGLGLVRQIDTLRPCTEGRALDHSPTVCTGVVGEACAYRCELGYTPSGSHLCEADGSFRGGSCRAS